jgi:hypothetical protein
MKWRWRMRQRRSREERFLSAQADTFAGANVKEKAAACCVTNDGGVGQFRENEVWRLPADRGDDRSRLKINVWGP